MAQIAPGGNAAGGRPWSVLAAGRVAAHNGGPVENTMRHVLARPLLALVLALPAGCAQSGTSMRMAGDPGAGPSRSLLDAYFIAHGMAFGATSARASPEVQAELDRLDARAAAAIVSLRPGASGPRARREAEAAVAALTTYAAARADGSPAAQP